MTRAPHAVREPVRLEKNAGVPDWAFDAVWYQIFPERFRNGDPANDPRAEQFSEEPIPGWSVTPWRRDWYARTEWERAMGPFYRSIYARRYGGDLAGVRQKLDYLQDLGINALYFNPLFMAPSLHKYDGSSFHHIDPDFGPDREGDLAALRRAGETEDPATWIWTAADRYFCDLVKEVHARGMRIILDGVFNHTGCRFFAFEDLLKNGRNSPYADWYRVTGWLRDGTPDYMGWFNHKALPELGRQDHNLAAPVRDYVFHITRRWMDPDGDGDPSDGIDGWRLDVAFCVPQGFWRDWRRLVKSINPEAYLTGEIVELADAYLQGDMFDAVMNYMWLYPSTAFFSPTPGALGAAGLRGMLDRLFAAYPRDVCHVQQNLLDSHDVARIATMLENPEPLKLSWNDYFEATWVKHHPAFRTTRPGTAAYQALRQMAVFQMTFVGAPMLYYGTEVGMWGANDPDNRQPMLWNDIPCEAEENSPQGRTVRSERAPDHELYAFFRKAIALRRTHPVLRRGALFWHEHPHDRLLAFERRGEGARVLVLLNTGETAFDFPLDGVGSDLWNETEGPVKRVATVAPRGWRVLSLPPAG